MISVMVNSRLTAPFYIVLCLHSRGGANHLRLAVAVPQK
jgi:hypothetical protein